MLNCDNVLLFRGNAMTKNDKSRITIQLPKSLKLWLKKYAIEQDKTVTSICTEIFSAMRSEKCKK